MLKNFIIILICLHFFQAASAQKQDTLKYYRKNNGVMVSTRDSADYYIYVLPPDSSSGQKLYPINQYYKNGKLRYSVMSATPDPLNVKMEGSSIIYYPNGNKQSVTNYVHGVINGGVLFYYPNGTLYTVVEYVNKQLRLVSCNDSTGKQLALNGSGQWLTYDNTFKIITGQGPITDSLKEGEWSGNINDTGKYVCLFKKDNCVSGIGYDHTGKAYPFTKVTVEPHFDGGAAAYSQFLKDVIRYPDVDRKNNVQGRVLVTFVVEKDGTITHTKIVKSVDPTIDAEAIRVVSLSPVWIPGQQYGMPTNFHYTLPLNFSLKN